MRNFPSHALVWVSLAGVLAGCSSVPEQAPLASGAQPSSNKQNEVTPRLEPPSRSGNPDTYAVFGKRYRVKESSAGHREVGTASWYGWDFHGRKTSSGPKFNMFELSAAHKSLPIPTYVQVTNLENGRQIVVKVNDRGPFVGDRVLDLSYAAAARLDMVDKGTAKVEVVALPPYQFLPLLAAKRAAQRERIASRAIERFGTRDKVASVQFAHDKPLAGRTALPPPRLLAQPTALRLAANSVTPPKSKAVEPAKLQLAAAAPPKGKAVEPAKLQLAAAAPLKGKVNPPLPKAAEKAPNKADKPHPRSAERGNPLYLVGTVEQRNSPSQVQSRLSSQMQRSVQVDAGGGKQPYQVRVPLRNPGEAKQVALRLASLGVSRSRVVSD